MYLRLRAKFGPAALRCFWVYSGRTDIHTQSIVYKIGRKGMLSCTLDNLMLCWQWRWMWFGTCGVDTWRRCRGWIWHIKWMISWERARVFPRRLLLLMLVSLLTTGDIVSLYVYDIWFTVKIRAFYTFLCLFIMSPIHGGIIKYKCKFVA